MNKYAAKFCLSGKEAGLFENHFQQFIDTPMVRVVDGENGRRLVVYADFSIKHPMCIAGFFIIQRDLDGAISCHFHGLKKAHDSPFPFSVMRDNPDVWFLSLDIPIRNLQYRKDEFVDRLVKHRNKQLQLILQECTGLKKRILADSSGYHDPYRYVIEHEELWSLAERIVSPGYHAVRDHFNIYNNLCTRDPDLLKKRIQALRAATFFWGRIANSAPVLEAIDIAKPLIPALCSEFDVRPCTIRHAAKFFPINENSGESALVRCLDAVAPEKRPKHIEDIQAFTSIVKSWYGGTLSPYKRQTSIPGRMLNLVGKNGFRMGLDNIQRHLRYSQAEDLSDTMEAMNNHCKYSDSRLIAHVDKRLSELSPHHLWRISDNYHRFLVEELGKEGDDDDSKDISWPKLLADPLEMGAYKVIELNTPSALRAEGLLMSHCVGTYPYTCIQSDVHILSIRSPETARPLATFEVRINRDSMDLTLVQSRGARNCKLSDDVMSLVQQTMLFLQCIPKAERQQIIDERKALASSLGVSGYNLSSGTERAMTRAIKRALPSEIRQVLVKSIFAIDQEKRSESNPYRYIHWLESSGDHMPSRDVKNAHIELRMWLNRLGELIDAMNDRLEFSLYPGITGHLAMCMEERIDIDCL